MAASSLQVHGTEADSAVPSLARALGIEVRMKGGSVDHTGKKMEGP